MGSVIINPTSLNVASYGVATGVTLTYNRTVAASADISIIGDWGTAEWTDASKTSIAINTVVNDSSTIQITGYLRVTAFDIDTGTIGTWAIQVIVLPKDTLFTLTPQRLDFTTIGGTMYIDCAYDSSLISASIQIQNKPDVGTMEFTDSTKSRIAVTLPVNTTESELYWLPNLWAMSSHTGTPKTLKIPITQAPIEEERITITPPEKTVHWIDSTTTADVELVLMGDIDITTNAPDWTTVSLENDKLTVAYGGNIGTTQRTALITLSGMSFLGNYRSATFTINQIGKPAPGSISVSPTEVSVGNDSGETATALLTMNQILMGSISTGGTDDWFTASVDETTGEVEITTLYKNPKNVTREAILTISATENVWLEPVSCTVVVKQEPSVDYDATLEWTSSVSHTVVNLGEVWDVGLICRGMDTTSLAFVDLPEWVGVVISESFDKVTFTVGANTTTDTRSATFTLTGVTELEGLIYEITYTITQGATLEAETFPVWEDKMVELPTGDFPDDYFLIFLFDEYLLPFKIVDINGDEDKDLFTGTVYKQEGNKINITPVIKSYLSTHLSFIDGWQRDDDAYKFFRLDLLVDENNTFMPYKLYKVWNDWSYSAVTGGTCVSNQIIKTVDDRQYFVMSFLNRLGDNPTTVTVNGASEVISDEIKHFVLKSPSSNVVVNGVTYPVKRTPYTYALYYRTKSGGWSWMLFNRASKRTDNVTRQTYTKQTYSFNPIEHANSVYGVDISSTWALKTNFLTDSQSEKFQDIVASPTMWLHDLEKDEVIPVVMSTSKAEHLGWANNSKHKVRYTIEVESSRIKQNNS